MSDTRSYMRVHVHSTVNLHVPDLILRSNVTCVMFSSLPDISKVFVIVHMQHAPLCVPWLWLVEVGFVPYNQLNHVVIAMMGVASHGVRLSCVRISGFLLLLQSLV